MTGDDVKQLIDNLPVDCSIKDDRYTRYVKSKILKGLKDLKESNVLSSDEVRARMNKWLKS